MALQLKGTVQELLAPEANEYNGKTWATQTIVVDCGSMEPHLVALEFDPDRDTVTSTAKVGEQVAIDFYPISNLIKSGKMEGKYTTRLKVKRIVFPYRTAAVPAAAAPQPSAPTPPPANEPAPTPVSAAADAATSDEDPF